MSLLGRPVLRLSFILLMFVSHTLPVLPYFVCLCLGFANYKMNRRKNVKVRESSRRTRLARIIVYGMLYCGSLGKLNGDME
jgi:hypothetical protein